MIAVFVTIQIKKGFKNQFMAALLHDARGSINNEPKCYRFDILQSDEDPNRIHLYEVYENDEAVESHRAQPHFTKWLSTVEPWFDGDRTRTEMHTVFPTDGTWREQKGTLKE